MNRRTGVLMVLGVIGALALGGTQAAVSKKHSHQTVHSFRGAQIVTPPGDINSGIVFCPGHGAASGGGVEYVDGLGRIAGASFVSIRSYGAIIDNFDSPFTAVNNVQVGCTHGTTRVRGKVQTRAQIEAKLEAQAAKLLAAHEAAE